MSRWWSAMCRNIEEIVQRRAYENNIGTDGGVCIRDGGCCSRAAACTGVQDSGAVGQGDDAVLAKGQGGRAPVSVHLVRTLPGDGEVVIADADGVGIEGRADVRCGVQRRSADKGRRRESEASLGVF